MRRIAVLLVAAGLLTWLAAPALSSRPFVAQAVEFEQALDASGWQPAGDGTWRSPVVRAPKRFDLVGLRWERSRGGERQARIRVRSAGGRWGRWTLMAQDHAGGAGAEPVWAGGADAYQLRWTAAARAGCRRASSTPPARRPPPIGCAHRCVAQRTAPSLRSRAPRRARRPGAARRPRSSRARRGAPTSAAPRAAPAYGAVQLGLVHHTVNANTYAPQDSAAIVLSICRYHRNENGWRDIGYNFLVDRYGQIFEGRAGGVDQPVIGAQAQGYNGVSTGVANIGTFSQEPQTEAGVAATAELLAWKLSLHGAPVAGQVTVTSAGGPSNRYAAGRPVTFERIAGHRDADKTACPGDAFFAQLGQIRARAAELAPQFAFAPPATGAVSLEAADRDARLPAGGAAVGPRERSRGAAGGRADRRADRDRPRLLHARPRGDESRRHMVGAAADAVLALAARRGDAARRHARQLAAGRCEGRADAARARCPGG